MSAMFPVTLSGVQVRRQGRRVIGPVDLVLSPQGPVMVLGPNGSGKTTLLRAMHGIERLNGGSITWAQADARRHAFVFQTPIVLRRSVADNLAYPLKLRKTPKADIARDVDHWLERTGLADLRATAATRLSGGERQKLAIARALIQRPDVLFLDEPCANLDGHTTREIETLLQDIAANGTQLIMSTHDMGQARRLAHEVVFVLDGKIHEVGEARTVFASPATPELAAFLKGDIVT